MADLPSIRLSNRRIWAIPLFDSEHRIWEDKEVFSRLRYDWNDIQVKGNYSLNNILIAVAKKYSSYSNEEIQNISTGIRTYSGLREGDVVFGITGDQEVDRIGQIIFESKTPRSRDFELEWLNVVKKTQAEIPIFNPKLEIQKVTARMLENLRLPVIFDEEKYFETVKSHPSADAFDQLKKIELDFIQEEHPIEDDKGGKISLFFGTNRNYLGRGYNDFYGDTLDDLKLGLCEVHIPKGHVQGEVERPKSFWVYQFPENENKHVVIENIREIAELDFVQKIADSIKDSPEKSALVFIHGYNTSFAEAAQRTAQIAWDIPFNGISGFFSWPSSGKFESYAADIEKADSSITAFGTFVELMVRKTGIDKMHLIAHSMGNRILTSTLNNLSNNTTLVPNLKIIKQIVLGAPDIDQDVFNNTILPAFKNIGDRRTLYSSDKDKALQISKVIRGGRPRLGDAGDKIFVNQAIDTIDASNVPSRGNNHSYIFDTKELLADLFYLLGKGFDPTDRRLRAVPKDGLNYWLFPK